MGKFTSSTSAECRLLQVADLIVTRLELVHRTFETSEGMSPLLISYIELHHD